MRTTIWKFQPKGAKQSEYSIEEGKEEGLEYIEKLKEEDEVVEVIEKDDRFVIFLK